MDLNKELNKLENILTKDSYEDSSLFEDYLTDTIIKYTKDDTLTIGKIASHTSSGKRDAFKIFPVNRHGYLSNICLFYKLDADIINKLYERAGLCIHSPEDDNLIDTFTQNEITKYVKTENFIDCYLKLVKNHNYYDVDNPDYSEKITKCIKKYVPNDYLDTYSDDEKQLAFKKLYNTVKSGASSFGWVLSTINEKFSNASSHIRESVFELAFSSGFNIAEIKKLYNSFGYTLNPEYIKFDAFVNFLCELTTTKEAEDFSYKMGIYKEVCSIMHYKKFERISPDYDTLKNTLEDENKFYKTLLDDLTNNNLDNEYY